MNPGISVIILTYNSAAFLPQAIESVLVHGYAPIELIVVDDGSTEDIEAILKPFLNKITYVQQENSGSAAACNHGLRLATHDYVLFLDAGDLLLPNKLQQQVASFYLIIRVKDFLYLNCLLK